MSENNEPEECVCVACRCSTIHRYGFGDPDSLLIVWVCEECHGDGSLARWLAQQLEEVLKNDPQYEREEKDGRVIYREKGAGR